MRRAEFTLLMRGVKALEGIRVALERFEPAEDEPEPPPAPVACEHPVELRIDFGVTDGVPDWQCGIRACGYRSREQTS